ncbi:hypothetical protein FOA43_001228 [Brettanomyces nanus]|uniref:Uncharacterized protein n=1 Tax=Eeniella nana TaxID=13502 RepID=A0A875RZ35_EENNA|nr:uncharacterized protein FOA43_001228 [Brettanomyces nanus]QPG73913.1 hypothetical protein FOA43_001228 [Brettanomyces nanus]
MTQPENSASTDLSNQSTILKPSLRPGDIRFISIKMFGKESLGVLDRTIRPMLSGSNVQLIKDGGTLSILLFDSRRRLLSYLFIAYWYYLKIQKFVQDAIFIVHTYLWGFVVILGLNDDDGGVDQYSLWSKKSSKRSPKMPSLWSIRSIPTRLVTKVANHALRKSLQAVTPPNRKLIRIAAGKGPLPSVIGVIFNLFPLVIPPPPEIPTPYLTADKKIVIPEKSDTSNALRARAEWSAIQHTHKATEIMRVCTEAARIIVWTTCLGIPNIVLQEINGYTWKNLDALVSLVQTELSSLDLASRSKDRCCFPDAIQFVNVATKQVKTLSDFIYDDNYQEDNLTPLQPTPVSGCPFLANSASFSGGLLHQDDYPSHLTVFLTSNHDDTDYQPLIELIKQKVQTETYDWTSEEFTKMEELAQSLENITPSPEVLIKYASERQQRYSLDGLPLSPDKLNLQHFYSFRPPATFPAFIKAVESYSRCQRNK